jgi:hypothetical protein
VYHHRPTVFGPVLTAFDNGVISVYRAADFVTDQRYRLAMNDGRGRSRYYVSIVGGFITQQNKSFGHIDLSSLIDEFHSDAVDIELFEHQKP